MMNHTDVILSCAGVRDYIHVVDLTLGHIAALKKLKENGGCKVRSGTYCNFTAPICAVRVFIGAVTFLRLTVSV